MDSLKFLIVLSFLLSPLSLARPPPLSLSLIDHRHRCLGAAPSKTVTEGRWGVSPGGKAAWYVEGRGRLWKSSIVGGAQRVVKGGGAGWNLCASPGSQKFGVVFGIQKMV